MKHLVSRNIIILMTQRSVIPAPTPRKLNEQSKEVFYLTWIYPSVGCLGIDFNAAPRIVTADPYLLLDPNRQIVRFSPHHGSPDEVIKRRLSTNPIALLAKNARNLRIVQRGERHAGGSKWVGRGKRSWALASRIDLSDGRIPVEILEREREEDGQSVGGWTKRTNATRGRSRAREEGTHVVFLVVDDYVRSGRSHDNGVSV